MSLPKCVYCGERAANGSRGLCKPCWSVPEIKQWYPPKSTNSGNSRPEPTAEQLDALIASRLPTMPGKYHNDGDAVETHRHVPLVGQILVRALGWHSRGRRVNRKKARTW